MLRPAYVSAPFPLWPSPLRKEKEKEEGFKAVGRSFGLIVIIGGGAAVVIADRERGEHSGAGCAVSSTNL